MTTTPASAVVFRRRILLGGILLAGVFGGAWAFLRSGAAPPADTAGENVQAHAEDVLHRAKGQLAAGQYAEAMNTANQAWEADHRNVAALIVSGEAATRLGQMDLALQTYSRVPVEHPPEYLLARLASAEIQRVAGSIDAAIELYQQVLQREPEHPLATERLAELFGMTGQTGAARPLLLQLVARGTCRVEHLQWLADEARPLQVLEYLEESLQRSPDQVGPHLGIARIRLGRGEVDRALEHLLEARQRRPRSPEIEANWGRALLELGRDREWTEWLAALPSGLRSHSDIWLQQGIMAERRGQKGAACRCSLEAIAVAPHLREATHRAARLLLELGQPEFAAPLLKRNELLGEVATLAGSVRADTPNGTACRREAEALFALGRDAEALAWAAYAVRATLANREWFDALQSSLRSRSAAATTPPLEELHTLVARLTSGYPLPDFGIGIPAPTPSTGIPTGPTVSFVDEARQVGIDFTYYESPDPTTEGRRMFEFTGGGVAVLDYDQDGWPDLYFTQGARIVERRPTGAFLDQLYRNRGGQSFANVTTDSRILETGYSQGATAGDFNNDGFPDVYVANLGPNRLFENLGDGTFLEVSLPEESAWTTSCAIADVNLDSIPDLFDVNYLQGEDIWDQICLTSAGPRVCTPFAFDAAPDRLCLGNGDGTFTDVTSTAEISPPHGKGLGLVIGPLGEKPGLDIFVANDTEANSLFLNDQPPGQSPRYRDMGILAGVAFGDDGQPQASMGIAAADFDGNGLLDLHVTNYANEPNALYLAQSGGAFEEASRRSEIRNASLPMLGFGTQALDVDLDGDWDLVVANGDLDDFSHEGRAFRMRPQLYLNHQGIFTEVISADAADYFSRNSAHRGRGLAKLDWNRDGREDFVVSHLDEPVALVTNRTATRNRMISLRLLGTASSRDAVGAVVTFTSSEGRGAQRWGCVTTGDGYHAKNEALVRFGVGAEFTETEWTVSWPQGHKTTHRVHGSAATVFLKESYD